MELGRQAMEQPRCVASSPEGKCRQRLDKFTHRALPQLVSLEGGSVLGYLQSDAVLCDMVDEVRRIDGPSVTQALP